MTPDQLATGGPVTHSPPKVTMPHRCENPACQERIPEGAYQYRCDECNAPVCTACSEDGPDCTVVCEDCAPLVKHRAGARARSIRAHRRRPNNPKSHAAFPHPVTIPFKDYWGTHRSHQRRGLVAAIEYHYDETARIYRPHAVFTAVEATEEERARHVGGRARCWYFDCWDFDYVPSKDATYYHKSGGGSPYTGATCYARRYRRRHPDKAGHLFGQSAIWWNPRVTAFRPASASGPDFLTPAHLRGWGWRVLPRPANLGNGLVDPFDSNGWYDSTEGATVWCNECQERVPEDESETCEHGEEEKE